MIVNPCPGNDTLDLTRTVLDAGSPVIQVRVKDVDDRQRLPLTRAVVDLCRGYDTTCIVDDRPDLAVLCEANGVHGGATDLPVQALRTIVGPDRLVGGTARDPFTARSLEEQGADYLGVGPIYSTSSKTGLPEPLGTEVLHEVALAVGIPVIAISGITVDRVSEVMATGAHGVAVIGAVTEADDPGKATIELLEALQEEAS